MKIQRVWCVVSLVAALALGAGCSSPCSDACSMFIEKAQGCGLGGPSGDDEVDSCAESLEQAFTGDACESMGDAIAAQSCDELRQSLCGDPSTASLYNCD